MTRNYANQIADARANVHAVREFGTAPVLLDCGANIGEVSINCAAQFERIVAVEANPDTFKVLKQRVKAARVRNVDLVNACVAGKSGETYFVSLPSACSTGSTARAAPRRQQQGYYKKVKTLSFADLLKTTQANVVKMDIEGSEYEALEGLTVPRYLRAMVVEFHGLPTHRAAVQAICKNLGRQGLKVVNKGDFDTKKWTLVTLKFERKKEK